MVDKSNNKSLRTGLDWTGLDWTANSLSELKNQEKSQLNQENKLRNIFGGSAVKAVL